MSCGMKTLSEVCEHFRDWTFPLQLFSAAPICNVFSVHWSTSSACLAQMGCCILSSKLGCCCSLKYCLAHWKEIINSSCQFNSTGLLLDIQWFRTYFLETKKQTNYLYMSQIMSCIWSAFKLQTKKSICLIFRQLKEKLVVHRKKVSSMWVSCRNFLSTGCSTCTANMHALLLLLWALCYGVHLRLLYHLCAV